MTIPFKKKIILTGAVNVERVSKDCTIFCFQFEMVCWQLFTVRAKYPRFGFVEKVQAIPFCVMAVQVKATAWWKSGGDL